MEGPWNLKQWKIILNAYQTIIIGFTLREQTTVALGFHKAHLMIYFFNNEKETFNYQWYNSNSQHS